ncbi:hypothetical protein O6H91_14G012500 [Diphasiastrum complanatum]|uniref:Uncharacterized protein n=1 Tax=Diphasiastrum complanatum TaxID=34168 RepID=A0ACC2BLL2_DIPCM|nr:hypothetical protein O6H91_14G012500 [Diphasiastrum complanatum]
MHDLHKSVHSFIHSYAKMNSHSSTVSTISAQFSSLAAYPFPHHHNHHAPPPLFLNFKSSSSMRADLVARSIVAGIAVGGTCSAAPAAASFSLHHTLPSSCFTINPITHLQFRKKGQTHQQFKQKGQLGKASAQLVTGEEVVDDVVSTSTDEDVVKKSISILKLAGKTRKVPPAEVLGAIRSLEKAKLDPSNFLETIGGTESPGRTWLLVFVASVKQVREAMKGAPGGGRYFPITAVQRFDAATMTIENGIYLGPLGFLSFQDDEIIVSRGRSGGLAFWCRCKKVTT